MFFYIVITRSKRKRIFHIKLENLLIFIKFNFSSFFNFDFFKNFINFPNKFYFVNLELFFIIYNGLDKLKIYVRKFDFC